MHHTKPAWNGRGITFATLAGVVGAVGALCVVFATVVFHGPKLYVAPVIFALAPVINTLISLFWHPDEGPFTVGLPREPVHWSLYLGVVLAGLGAGLVLYAQALSETHGQAAAVTDYTFVIFVLLAGLSWGAYVPLIAQGGKELKSSYASFLCVGGRLFRHRRPAAARHALVHEQPAAAPRPAGPAAAQLPDRRHPRHARRGGRRRRRPVRHLRHFRVQRSATSTSPR